MSKFYIQKGTSCNDKVVTITFYVEADYNFVTLTA